VGRASRRPARCRRARDQVWAMSADLQGEFLGVRGRSGLRAPVLRRQPQAAQRRDHRSLYQHRVDPKVPIEDTVARWRSSWRRAKVRHLGVVGGRAGDDPPRREGCTRSRVADRIFAVEPRSGEPPCRRRHANSASGSSAYSPLGRGFFSPGDFKDAQDLPVDDVPAEIIRVLRAGNFERTCQLVAKIEELARPQGGCTPSQARARLGAGAGPDIVPIPGTKQIKYVDENLGAADIALAPEELREIDAVLPVGSAGRRSLPRASHGGGESLGVGRYSWRCRATSPNPAAPPERRRHSTMRPTTFGSPRFHSTRGFDRIVPTKVGRWRGARRPTIGHGFGRILAFSVTSPAKIHPNRMIRITYIPSDNPQRSMPWTKRSFVVVDSDKSWHYSIASPQKPPKPQ